MKDCQGKTLERKDVVKFMTKFGEAVGIVQHISDKFAKVYLQVDGFGVYTWCKSGAELEKITEWSKVY